MDKKSLLQLAKHHLKVLCSDIADRSVGSKGNRDATDYCKKVMQENKWNTEETKLDVMDWKTDGAKLTCAQKEFEVFSSPYSMGCNVKGELVSIHTINDLENTDLSGKIVLLYDEITKEQIMPKNFVFYNPEEHQRVVSALINNLPLWMLGCANNSRPTIALNLLFIMNFSVLGSARARSPISENIYIMPSA